MNSNILILWCFCHFSSIIELYTFQGGDNVTQSKKNIKDLCKFVSRTFDLATFYIDPIGNVIFEETENVSLNPIYHNEKQNLFTALDFNSHKEFHFPVIRRTLYFEKYITVSVFNHKTFEGTILIGPTISKPLSEEKIIGIINDTKAFTYRKNITHYYQTVPILQHEQLVNISAIIFHLFNHVFLSPEVIISKNNELFEPQEKNKVIELSVSKYLQQATFDNDHLFEKTIVSIIKEGRIGDLKNINLIKDIENVSAFSKSSFIRSLKNHIITLITLVSRAAIEGGLHQDIAFSLNDSFIQHLEELNKVDEIRLFTRDVLFTFAEKVHELKTEKYSKTINLCKDYIITHIYDDISVVDIADAIGLSPKYLSLLFKKEVGITISDYIRDMRIEEAKKLLAYSSTPISEICALLNYTDQSYFTKVFKKQTGKTPKLYREKFYILEDH